MGLDEASVLAVNSVPESEAPALLDSFEQIVCTSLWALCSNAQSCLDDPSPKLKVSTELRLFWLVSQKAELRSLLDKLVSHDLLSIVLASLVLYFDGRCVVYTVSALQGKNLNLGG